MPCALIVFSHLRWSFVYQRPQHLLSRLARHRKIYFVEEPVSDGGRSRLEIEEVEPGVFVCQPRTPLVAKGFHDEQIPLLRSMISDLIKAEKLDDYAVWFYSPMALPLMQSLSPRGVVYDCMDELSAFKGAPKQIIQRESALFQRADLVFTGGPSLQKAKESRHESVHCFPSSVDAAHFRAGADGAPEHMLQASIPGPRLGFFGVIDERLDLELLGALADAHPAWQIVMVGPVVKISAAQLPVRANIHYFGQQSYQDLPAFLRGWDVCLLPFALNEATRFISPTKTLEYMAAGKPIVSTPIVDVAEPYSDVVRIAAGSAEFIAACEAALAETPTEREARQIAMRARLARTSWDTTAQAMNDLLAAAFTEMGAERHANPVRAATHDVETAIIGAGPTGLSAAYHLGRDSILLEQGSSIGGWCRSIEVEGFTFDYAGHIMFSNDAYVLELYEKLLGENVHWQNREAWIYSHGVHTRYPFQSALHGLPAEVLKECLVGAIEARFGGIGSESTPASLNGAHADCCADGTSVDTTQLGARAGARTKQPARNFEEFIYSTWGAGVAKHFAVPYNRKLWATPLHEMETSWLGGRVPLPNLEEMIDGALRPGPKPVGPNARFGYPLCGGFQALMDGFLPLLDGQLELNARVERVIPSQHLIVLADKRSYRYGQLISTAPLPQLVRMIGNEAPAIVREAAANLRHVSVRCVHLGVQRADLTDKHWIYYPEDTVFHRIFVQGNASPHCSPPGCLGLTCEISYSPSKPLPCDGQALIDLCIADCKRTGMLREDYIVSVGVQVDMPYAYVVYDHGRQRNVDIICQWLDAHDILPAGRYAQWQYYNSDHAFLAGKDVAEQVRKRLRELPKVARSSSRRSAALHAS